MRVAGVAHGADHLALAHALAHGDADARLVAVAGGQRAGVLDAGVVAVAARPSPRAPRVPQSAARIGVPVGAAMSMPACRRPQRMPKGDVKVPFTGQISRPLPRRIGPAPPPAPPGQGAARSGPAARSSAARSSSGRARRWRVPPPARVRRPLRSVRSSPCAEARRSRVEAMSSRRRRIVSAAVCLRSSSLASSPSAFSARALSTFTRVDDLAVLVGDPLEELGALEQVGEAVGLEHHGERVGLVGLVELDQAVGERARALPSARRARARAGRGPPRGRRAPPAAPRALPSSSACTGREAPLRAADLALEAADAVVVALDVLWSGRPPCASCCSTCARFFSMRLDRGAVCPGRGSST